MTTHYWVNTVSLEHVLIGVAGGFTQADHGRDTRLRRLHSGDGIVFYSPRTAMRSGESLQRFTALGAVSGDEPYQVAPEAVAEERAQRAPRRVRPWRLAVDFEDVGQAAVRPLVDQLEFIPDKQRWGYPFRRGLFEVPAGDFETIAEAMRSAI